MARLSASRAAETREAIYAASMDAFLSSGYEATSVESICAAAGVAKGSFFNYFPSKASLLKEWVGRWFEAKRSRFPPPDGVGLEGRLLALAALFGDSPREELKLFGWLVIEGFSGSLKATGGNIGSGSGPWIEFLTSVMSEGDGGAPLTDDPAEAATLLSHLWFGAVASCVGDASKEPSRELAKAARFFARGAMFSYERKKGMER